MHQSVREQWMDFTTQFEGRVAWMYLDVKGWVTTGVGNLIDPKDVALRLPFVDKNTGAAASTAEIEAEWDRLKADAHRLARAGHRACENITELRLSDADIDDLVLGKLDEMERFLQSRFPDYDSWPADAQLGVLSMAWAMGPGFRYPNFSAAANAGDWRTAALECTISEAGNPGVAPRNVANRKLFTNAASVVENSFDPAFLYYPVVLDEQPLDQPADEQPVDQVAEEPAEDPAVEEPMGDGGDTTVDETFDQPWDSPVEEPQPEPQFAFRAAAPARPRLSVPKKR